MVQNNPYLNRNAAVLSPPPHPKVAKKSTDINDISNYLYVDLFNYLTDLYNHVYFLWVRTGRYSGETGNGNGTIVPPSDGNGFSTGDVKASYKLSEDGWVVMNNGTIGNATSGATYANPNTEALFILLYTNVTNAWCPVSGGRTGDALNDFNFGKTLTIPQSLGRAMCSIGIYEGGAPDRVMGEYLGENEHVLTVDELATHNHTVSLPPLDPAVNLVAGAQTGLHGTPSVLFPTSNTGNNDPHNNMQPSMFLSFLIKL